MMADKRRFGFSARAAGGAAASVLAAIGLTAVWCGGCEPNAPPGSTMDPGSTASGGAAGGAGGGAGGSAAGGGTEVGGAGAMGGEAGAAPLPEVAGIEKVRDNVKSLDWSAAHDLLVSEGTGLDGKDYFDVYHFAPDGSGAVCVTCGATQVPKHNGNPAWHPSGEWIAFTAQKADSQPDPKHAIQCVPGKGLHHDLWVVDLAGAHYAKLDTTDMAKDQRLIHPQFSHDGTRIAWAVQVSTDEDPPDPAHHWGQWEIRLAEFVVENGEPAVKNVQACQPGSRQQFYETHGFSADGTELVFSGNLEPEQPPVGLDIYALDVSGGKCDGALTRKTFTQNDWDEHGHYSPDQQWLAWISSEGLDIEYPDVGPVKGYDLWSDYLATELWLMPAKDGWASRKWLTDFNALGAPGSRYIVADSAWSPDSHRIALAVMGDTDGNGAFDARDLYMLELAY
jgi:hypothetical protein